MACCIANVGWHGVEAGAHLAGDLSPSCASQARVRSFSAFSESDLESLFSDVDFKLSQWSANLKNGAMRSLAVLPELSVAEETPPGTVYLGSTVKSRPSTQRFAKRNPCDAGLLGSTAALADLAALSWFATGAAPPSLCSIARTIPVGAGFVHEEALRGVVMVRGSLEDTYNNPHSMHVAVRDALRDALTPVAVLGVDVSVVAGKQTVRSDLGTSKASQSWIAFEFEVRFADQNDQAPALALLRLEAATGGALRVLPSLAKANLGMVGHIVVRIEVVSEMWMLSHRDGSYDLDERRKI